MICAVWCCFAVYHEIVFLCGSTDVRAVLSPSSDMPKGGRSNIFSHTIHDEQKNHT